MLIVAKYLFYGPLINNFDGLHIMLELLPSLSLEMLSFLIKYWKKLTATTVNADSLCPIHVQRCSLFPFRNWKITSHTVTTLDF
jgi:hypothetical protein